MQEGTAPNGGYVSAKEHETLRQVVNDIREEQKRQAESLRFIESQARLTGQALELLLAERGLEMPEE